MRSGAIFTINGLSVGRRDGKVHDHVGGLQDIEAKRVRFIGRIRISAICRGLLAHSPFSFRMPCPPFGAGETRIRDGVLACIRGTPRALPALSAERGADGNAEAYLVADGRGRGHHREDGRWRDCCWPLFGGWPIAGPFIANDCGRSACLGSRPDPIRRLGRASASPSPEDR